MFIFCIVYNVLAYFSGHSVSLLFFYVSVGHLCVFVVYLHLFVVFLNISMVILYLWVQEPVKRLGSWTSFP